MSNSRGARLTRRRVGGTPVGGATNRKLEHLSPAALVGYGAVLSRQFITFRSCTPGRQHALNVALNRFKKEIITRRERGS